MTETKRIKPIRVMHQEGVSELEMHAAMDGTRELLALGGVEDLIKIIDLDVWRNNAYRNSDGSLKEFQSVDWYLHKASLPHLKGERRRRLLHEKVKDDQVLTNQIIDDFWTEQLNNGNGHYNLIVCREDLNDSYHGFKFISGQGGIYVGAVSSVLRLRDEDLDSKTHYECVKSLVMHELSHAFGTPDAHRTDLDPRSGGHCRNICIMRRGAPEPISKWVEKSNDRIRYGALCEDCHNELKTYFGTQNGSKKMP